MGGWNAPGFHNLAKLLSETASRHPDKLAVVFEGTSHSYRFRGYWGMPGKTRESFVEGWFRSGDLGYQDPKDGGRLYLVGRAKERKASLSNNKSELAEK